jgi:hypothetical protein
LLQHRLTTPKDKVTKAAVAVAVAAIAGFNPRVALGSLSLSL